MTYRETPQPPPERVAVGAVEIDDGAVREIDDGVEVVRITRSKVLSLGLGRGFVAERIPLLIAVGAATLTPVVALLRVAVLEGLPVAHGSWMEAVSMLRLRSLSMPVFLALVAGFCFRRALQRGSYLVVTTPDGVRKLPFHSPDDLATQRGLLEEARRHFGYHVDDAAP